SPSQLIRRRRMERRHRPRTARRGLAATPPISAPTSAPLSLARSARASASIIVSGAPFRPSRVGDRTDSYSRLWQDDAKLALISPLLGGGPPRPRRECLSRGADHR